MDSSVGCNVESHRMFKFLADETATKAADAMVGYVCMRYVGTGMIRRRKLFTQ